MAKKKVSKKVIKKKVSKKTKEKKRLTDFDWDKKYTYDDTVQSHEFDTDGSQDGMFETFGPDHKHVLKVQKKTPKRVWTAIENDSGDTVWIAGYHFVNRLYYIISKEEWTDESKEYVLMCGEN